MSQDDKATRASAAREKIARLRANFVSQLPARIAEAEGLLERITADPALPAPRADLHRLLHSLKGTGRSFGLLDLGDLAAEAEDLAARLDEPAISAPDATGMSRLRKVIQGMAALAGQAAESADTTLYADNLDLPGQAAKTRKRECGRVVYICDDDPAQLARLAEQLACFGYDTVPFADPALLREAIQMRWPDAVVMDIQFPDGHLVGPEVLAAIGRENDKSVPALFMSAGNSFEARLAAVQAGGEAYFTKPVRIMELVAAIDEITCRQEPEPYRILVVDDEPAVASYHAVLLQEAGMKTHHISDASRLLDVLDDFRPDMVLMDMYMPGCNGRELAKLIRQVPDHVGLPIVFLSSETDRQIQFSAMRVGAEGFLTKPVVPSELVSAVAIRAERMRTLRSLMARDSLTGLFNHSTTTQLIETALGTARRNNGTVCMAMIDIDRFKSINDTYGHPVGDQVILAIARVLQQRLRNSDIVGRYGGEEFAVILQDTPPEQAARLIDALREDFSHVLFHSGEETFSCTFSAGIACYPRHRRLEQLREAADKALYEAKRGGRNRVVVD